MFLLKSEKNFHSKDSQVECSISQIPLQCDNNPGKNLHLFARVIILNITSTCISSVRPVFKKGDKTNIKNNRPFSGLVQIGKLLEK